MRFLLIILLMLPIEMFCQKSNNNIDTNKFEKEIQISSLNFSRFGGSLLLGNFFYKFNKYHYIGLSTGFFYMQNKNSKDNKMKYFYIPFFVSYKFKFLRNYIKFDLGTNILSYFDSDYYIQTSDNEKVFWPIYSDIEDYETIERKKYFFIFSHSLQLQMFKKLYFIPGYIMYFQKDYVFHHLNLGLNYKF